MAANARYDLLVVGGGINGAGIARDAAGRGLTVLLCEQDDLAGHTSGASTKLIHGGLRYLEQRAFLLVGKALAEREVLLRAAPHISQPLRFVLPHQPHLRPAWMIRLGLFLYDHLDFGKRKLLPGSHAIDLRTHPAGAPLQPALVRGFVYSDGWVQDARLVVLNAMAAAERGATVLTRTRCVGARRVDGLWRVRLGDADGGEREVEARALVNAAGPWVARLLDEVLHAPHARALRLVKGSHIIVPKCFDHPYAYIFQNPDQRIVFAIPYERDYTLIGTTDVEYAGDPRTVAIDDDEIRYLCQAASRYFRQPVRPADVVWRYSGVRPLLDDDSGAPAEVTRDYRLELDAGPAPLLSVFGGKLTTYRKLAEEAVDRLAPLLGCSAGAWTGAGAPLPGGDIADADVERFLAGLRAAHPWLPPELAARLARTYGTRTTRLLGAATCLAELGECLGADLHAAEVDYLVAEEWARSAEDILWRRTKLGLRFDAAAVARLERYLGARTEQPARRCG